MLVQKITHGFVTQVFDTDTNRFIEQTFTAGDEVEYETAYGEVVDESVVDDYLPFDMVQPEEVFVGPIETKLNATWDDLYKQIARMTPEQRACNLSVELKSSEEYYSSTGFDENGTPAVRLSLSDDNGVFEEDTPVIIVDH